MNCSKNSLKNKWLGLGWDPRFLLSVSVWWRVRQEDCYKSEVKYHLSPPRRKGEHLCGFCLRKQTRLQGLGWYPALWHRKHCLCVASRFCWLLSLIWEREKEGPLEKGMATHSSILPIEFHGQRSLATVHGVTESDMIKWLSVLLTSLIKHSSYKNIVCY